jgi:hypothetical protein
LLTCSFPEVIEVSEDNLRWRSAGKDLQLSQDDNYIGEEVEVFSVSEEHGADGPRGWRKAEIVNQAGKTC